MEIEGQQDWDLFNADDETLEVRPELMDSEAEGDEDGEFAEGEEEEDDGSSQDMHESDAAESDASQGRHPRLYAPDGLSAERRVRAGSAHSSSAGQQACDRSAGKDDHRRSRRSHHARGQASDTADQGSVIRGMMKSARDRHEKQKVQKADQDERLVRAAEEYRQKAGAAANKAKARAKATSLKQRAKEFVRKRAAKAAAQGQRAGTRGRNDRREEECDDAEDAGSHRTESPSPVPVPRKHGSRRRIAPGDDQ